MSDQGRLSLPMRFCCAVTSTDPDILVQCNGTERRRIVRHAIALFCTFTMAAALWAAVLNEILPIWGAIIGGLFAGLIIYLLDLSISTSDWTMKGVLRESMFSSMSAFSSSLARKATFALRMGLAFILALVTGTYISMILFSESIEGRLHQNRILVNKPIEEEFRTQRENIRAELITPLQEDLNAAMAERRNLQESLVRSQKVMHEAGQNASQARTEMHREKTGIGRPEGPGKRYYDAKIRFEEANRHMEVAQQNIDHDRSRINDVEVRIDRINSRLQEANQTFDARITALARERDAKRVTDDSDFIMKFQALEELKSDATSGSAVTYIAFLTKTTIIILEGIFVLTLIFDHASIYILRQVGQTKLEAARVDSFYARAISRVNQEEDYVPGSNGVEIAEEPLFEIPIEEASNEQESQKHHKPVISSCDEPPLRQTIDQHPVIGGTTDERVTTAEALANRNRYWVNPDDPSEIWNRKYLDDVLHEEKGTAD